MHVHQATHQYEKNKYLLTCSNILSIHTGDIVPECLPESPVPGSHRPDQLALRETRAVSPASDTGPADSRDPANTPGHCSLSLDTGRRGGGVG